MKAVPFRARIRGRQLDTTRRPLIMGIVNVTPDSFSDGGLTADAPAAIAHALRLVDEGARIIDIGGESTRPGARPVSVREELRRVIPVIRRLRQREPHICISVDTLKADVAAAALSEGADIINDVSALSADPRMADICAKGGCHVVLMHRRGNSLAMYRQARYRDISREVASELKARIRAAESAGIRKSRIVIDPGIGFAKKAQDSWKLLLNMGPVVSLGYPVLCGWSRKSFLSDVAGDAPAERLAGTLALIGPVIHQGISILRVHDVAATRATIQTLERVHIS